MSDQLVEQLKEMGVSDKTARYALERSGNDVTKAANYIFSGAAGKDEVSPITSSPSLSKGGPLATISEGSVPPPVRPSPWRQFSLLSTRIRRDSVGKDEERESPSARRVSDGQQGLGESSLTQQSSDLILGALRGRQGTVTPTKPIPSPPPKAKVSVVNVPSIIQPSKPVGAPGSSSKSRDNSRTRDSGSKSRDPSPFWRARRSREKARERAASPEVGPLEKDTESDGESISSSKRFRPQASAYEDEESGTEAESESDSDMDDETLNEDEDFFDEETEKNTEANAYFKDQCDEPGEHEYEDRSVLDTFGEEIEQDILGEGPNVVVPPQPIFQSAYAPKRRTTKSGLELTTSRPSFARDRCTITLTHGDPDGSLEHSGKRLRRYVVLSDLSNESRYAVEWAIGTVARDGDEVFLISVKEDESKVDPKTWSNSDRAQKLKIQKERQTTALLLTRQVTGLLQRTRLHITVTCQFLHAKNARHMLLDLIDFLEPTMVIVGSRGLSKMKGILLGSTSHYLVQKSSVPVMVARRRLQRTLRKTDPAKLMHSPRVSLASASIEKTASTKQEDEVVDVAETEEPPEPKTANTAE